MEENKLRQKFDIKTTSPKMAKVIMLNDDYTTMDFVVKILVDIFNKNAFEAQKIMLSIHNNGKGLCGIYPYDIAHTKANMAKRRSKNAGYPLRILVENI